jgi:hypothetical protein
MPDKLVDNYEEDKIKNPCSNCINRGEKCRTCKYRVRRRIFNKGVCRQPRRLIRQPLKFMCQEFADGTCIKWRE